MVFENRIFEYLTKKKFAGGDSVPFTIKAVGMTSETSNWIKARNICDFRQFLFIGNTRAGRFEAHWSHTNLVNFF